MSTIIVNNIINIIYLCHSLTKSSNFFFGGGGGGEGGSI